MSVLVSTPAARTTERVRHELKFRLLQVRRVQRITPAMVRVTLGGDALTGFASAAHDDHVKLFFPAPGEERPVLPEAGPNGSVFPEGVARPVARDYTPRRFDPEAGELDIDFALHGDGPATQWAAQASPGQWLGVGGPRGSFLVHGSFHAWLLVGDATALPAIARRLEELPAHARAIAVVEVADAAERQALASRASVDAVWVERGDALPGTPHLLRDAVMALALPAGDIYAWVAAEAAAARAVRQHLVEVRRMPREWVKASAYWKRGAVDSHESLSD
jgi:NADPH-dependent ferric siderophore reductase